MPIQPSTQVAHIPLNGLTASSVRFLVSVAAEALRRVKVMAVSPLFLHYVGKIVRPMLRLDITAEGSADFAGMARFEETHCIVVTLETYGRNIDAAVAQGAFGLWALAARFADRADVKTSAALAAQLAGLIEGPSDAAIQAAAGEANGAGHHLLLAGADAQPALDAGFVLTLVAALAHSHRGGHVLNALRLRADCDVHLDQQFACLFHPGGVREHLQSVLCGQATGRLEAFLPPVVHFHQAQPAGPVWSKPVLVTKRRDWNAQEARRFEHSGSAFDFNVDAINLQRGHGTLLYSTSTA